MKEVPILIRNENSAVIHVVAFIDPSKLKKAGLTEEAFRFEVISIISADAFKSIMGELFSDLSLNTKDSKNNKEEDDNRSLYVVKNEAMRSILDTGVTVEVHCVENGKTKSVKHLTITSTGISEK